MKRLVLVLLLALPVLAQDAPADAPKAIPQDRLSFAVQGTARVPADQVEVEFVVQASGEDGDSTEQKQREKLKKVRRALEKVVSGKKVAPKDDGDDEEKPRKKKRPASDEDVPEDEGTDPPSFSMSLREGRSSIGVPVNQGQGQGDSVTIGTALIVTMKGISELPQARLRRKLALLLDTAIDAGADSGVGGVGVRPAFRFRARDNEALRAAAQKDALEKGRARAAQMARLAGHELGSLSSLAETGWVLRSGNTDQVGFDSVVGKIGNNKLNNYEMTTSTTEIELEVEMTLEFQLGKDVSAETPPAKTDKR